MKATFMKTSFLLIFMVFYSIGFSQTNVMSLTDTTQNSIKAILETYPPQEYDFNTKQNVLTLRTVTFTSCVMKVVDTYEGAGAYGSFSIPLKDIYVPTTFNNPDWPTNMEIVFKVSSGEKTITKEVVFDNYPKSSTKEYLSQVTVKINKNCKTDNKIDRLISAFKRAIKTCGGTAN